MWVILVRDVVYCCFRRSKPIKLLILQADSARDTLEKAVNCVWNIVMSRVNESPCAVMRETIVERTLIGMSSKNLGGVFTGVTEN